MFPGLVQVAILSLIWVTFAHGQQIADCHERTVVVSVLDRQGNVVAGLRPTDFRAKFRGKSLKVEFNAVTIAPRRVVILVDLSGSTLTSSEFARLLAGNLASTQRGKLRPALVLFSDHIVTSLDFSHSPEEIVQRLDNLPEHKGQTALFDALKYAADLFVQPFPGDSVYLISDGGENTSKARRSNVEREFLAKGIRIYSFRLGGNFFPTEEEANGPTLLKDLADLTGGAALDIAVDSSRASRKHLASELERLYRQMTDFYELQMQLPSAPIRKPQRWELEILNGQGMRRKDVQVIYPQQFTPCAGSVE